jgi:hypothetical protein
VLPDELGLVVQKTTTRSADLRRRAQASRRWPILVAHEQLQLRFVLLQPKPVGFGVIVLRADALVVRVADVAADGLLFREPASVSLII